MVNAQQWLDSNYPKDKRASITELNIRNKNLEGNLNLNDFINLTQLSCSQNQLTNLDVSKCVNLTNLDCLNNNLTNLDVSKCVNLTQLSCSYNQLTDTNFLTIIPHPEKLTNLGASNNQLTGDLTIFSKFVNLRDLFIGNDNPERITNGIYNRWHGSLEPLKNLTELEELCIEATDIDSGLEYLPDSLNEAQYDSDTESYSMSRVYCSPKKRPGSKVAKIKEQLKPYNYNLGKWKNAHPDLVLKAKLARQDKQIKFLQTEINILKTQKKDLENKLNSEIAVLRTNLTNKEQELTNSLRNLDQLKKDLTQKNEQNNNLESTIASLQQKLKDKEEELAKVLRESNTSTATLRAEITQIKEDLKKAQEENAKVKDLEENLLTLTAKSSLLVKQVEDLTNQTTTLEQEKERFCLEKSDLEKSYHHLLQTSETNLKQAQEIITAKTETLTKLEEEKNILINELEQAQNTINNLENNKIIQLENKIKDLENSLIDDENKNQEITRLKGELVNEKNRFKQELQKLQTELTNAKLREEQLSLKIKNLTSKSVKTPQQDQQENSSNSSWWEKAKTPLLFAGAIAMIIIAYGWVKSKVKKN